MQFSVIGCDGWWSHEHETQKLSELRNEWFEVEVE